ncbi:hypothetical protein [Aeromicrobium sp.]|uniref:hypothetical protein n=1 Tax=Aeromicrobium sp. TaxID=1871063 RepID=UPI0019A99475|nr:hypothetical protein [Aeromicrobium sp.]MBC7632821.1 hypothetical protein [Aeromicrobium sp.]
MKRRLGPISAAAPLVLAAGLTLSACGKQAESNADRPESSSASAPVKANDTTLTRATFASAITAALLRAKTSHISMAIEFGGQSIEAEGDVSIGSSVADTSMALTLDLGAAGAAAGAAGSLDMRLIDETLYLKLGPMTDNKFAVIDLKDDSSPIGKQYSQLVDQMDPSKQLEQIEAALVSIDKKGTPITIDGVDSQPYVIVIDTTKIPGMSALAGDAASALPDTITFTMFVSKDNLLRRLAAEVAGSSVKVDYTRWGEKVDAKAPAAGDITDKDLESLLGGATTAKRLSTTKLH